MNNEELKATIENLEKTILDLKNELEDRKCSPANIEEYKRWRAEKNELYSFLDQDGFISDNIDYFSSIDDFRYSFGNYFETIEKAIAYKEKLITKQQLKDLALRLNQGVEIDWEDDRQNKYCIYYDYGEKMCFLNWQQISRSQGTVYCSDENFLEIAKQEIGEEKLIELIKSGV